MRVFHPLHLNPSLGSKTDRHVTGIFNNHSRQATEQLIKLANS